MRRSASLRSCAQSSPGYFKALDDLAKEVISLIDPSNEEKGGFEALVKALKKVVSKLNTDMHAIWHPVPLRMAGHSKNLVQVIKHSGHPLLQPGLCVKKQVGEIGI